MGAITSSAEKTDPLIGRVINGRFKIEALIARGGMGSVYKAEQQPLGRVIALKVLDPRYSGEEDPEFHQRFFLEASVAAKLTHPNTVTIFDYGRTEDEVYFIAMEYVEGPTLAQILKADGPMEPERAVGIAVQVARSLREAHGIGVIHRDLKPANILITQHGDHEDFAKVLDFGLVKNIESEGEDLTQQGIFMGSPKYMSPEQIRSGDVDGRTDVYSLGVVLYRMLTGRVPFQRQSQVQTLMAHCTDPVPPLSSEEILIPEPLENVVVKALAKNPDERYASMNELVAALKQASQGLGVPMAASGDYGLGSSGVMPVGDGVTPSGPLAVLGGTPSDGFMAAVTPSGAVEIPIDVEATGAGKGKLMAVLVLLLAAAGGAYLALSGGTPVDTQADGSGAPTVDSRASQGATHAPVAVEDPGAAGAQLPGTLEQVPAPAPDPVPLPRVQLTLTSDPPGAEVFLGERSYGTTPASVEWVGDSAAPGREVSFSFRLAGYRDRTITRTLTEDPEVSVGARLTPIHVAGSNRMHSMGRMSASMSMSAGAMADEAVVSHGEDYLDNPY
ncbi:MAG: protein kinase [Deltaproteobacteria bacterium]|nr:protein kinase [Deltaproteobacteria bacterium]